MAEHALHDACKAGDEGGPDVGRITEAALRQRFGGHFDLVIAFSVFTHLAPDQAADYLRLFHALTRPSGLLLLTAHLDMPWNGAERRLGPADHGFRDCYPDRPLQLALYDLARLAALATAAGWRVWRVNFGVRDVGLPAALHHGQHGQDVLVCSKIPDVPADFDATAYLRANPHLRVPESAAGKHYRRSGYFEDRPVR